MIGNSQEISQWLWNQDREKTFEIKEYKKKKKLKCKFLLLGTTSKTC